MFDKEKFSIILKNILNQYENSIIFSEMADVNRTYVSKYMNMKLDNPPTPKILKKIADNSKGITNYEELMEVCGYLNNPLKNEISDENFTDFMMSFYELSEKEQKILIELMQETKDDGKINDENIEKKLNKKVFFKKISTNEKNRIFATYKKTKLLVFNSFNIHLFSTSKTSTQTYKKIPVLGSIPAGIPIELIEDIIDWEDISEDMLKGGKEYFALRVRGMSMYPKYLDGDTIIVLKQDDCESGQDAIIMVNGDDGTFKRVIKKETGITLEPINQQEFNSVSYTNEEIMKLPIRILGVVKEIRRKI